MDNCGRRGGRGGGEKNGKMKRTERGGIEGEGRKVGGEREEGTRSLIKLAFGGSCRVWGRQSLGIGPLAMPSASFSSSQGIRLCGELQPFSAGGSQA